MIIKTTRGNDFDGLFAYVLRHGQHRHLGEARIIKMEGVYDERTAAAQMAYNAALAPSRTRPVVHLMGRAEKPLTDPQYVELAHRMMRAARLEGHPFMAVVHDDGHLHVVACEMDDEGRPPARWLWHAVEKREVDEREAAALPRGAVKSRAWDSHLAWRLTELERELEVEWGLTRLSSAPQRRDGTPKIDRWQQERLERSAEVPLQDRYREQVRAALALPRWDDRIATLAHHGLTIRVHRVGERVRGLQVQSLSNADDFVKISAFEMGGMTKLDATADQPFLQWESARRAAKVSLRKTNLRKPEATFEPEMARLRATFRDELRAWHVSQGRRTKAFKQYKRDKALIQADLVSFEQTMSPHLSAAAMRTARREKRGGMQVLAKARLEYELTLAGPERSRPVFIDFVKARAGLGDAGAARVYRDIVGGVTETQRREHDRKVAELAAAMRDLRARADIVAATLKRSGEQMRIVVRDLTARASEQRALVTSTAAAAVKVARERAVELATRLAQRLDAAAHRIRVDREGQVRVDRWSGSSDEQRLVADSAHRSIFTRRAQSQTAEIAALSREVIARRAVRRVGEHVTVDLTRLPADMSRCVRWAGEPEIVSAVASADRANQAEAARREREETARLDSEARAAAERHRVERITAMTADLRSDIASLRTREVILRQREAEAERELVRLAQAAMERAATDRARSAAREDHARLLAAVALRPGDAVATRTYLNAWATALRTRQPEQPVDQQSLHAIDLAATRVIIKDGLSANAMRRIVAERSPARSDAAVLFDEALRDPATRRAYDDRLEAQDRLQTETWLREREPLNEAGERFIDLWIEILGERPLDASIPPMERNRVIDYEVATAMLAENLNLQKVQSLVAGLSPAVRAAAPADRGKYIDELMSVISDGLPDNDPRRVRVPLFRLIGQHPVFDDDEDVARTELPDAISNAPRTLSESAGQPDASGRVVINGQEIVVADQRAREGAGRSVATPAKASAGGDTDLFDANGRPRARVAGLLNHISQNRNLFEYEGGTLVAKSLNQEAQEGLARLLRDERVLQLALKAWRNQSPSPASRMRDGGMDR